MGDCNSFSIQYYDPFTLEVIATGDDDVVFGNGMKLKDFPTLTYERPYVLFKVLHNGNCIENSIIPDVAMRTPHDIGTEEASLETNVIEDSAEIEQKVMLHPNPNQGAVRIESTLNIDRIEVFNALGEAIDFTWQNDVLSLNETTSGTFLVKVVTSNATVFKHLIIL